MQYRKLGQLSDHISALGFGCMRIPGSKTNGQWVWEEETCIRMFRRAIELGINYFDTAYPYSDRQNERILGEALDGGYREKVFLTSKLPSWLIESSEDFPRIFAEQLKNLRTDHLDLYLLHAIDRDRWVKLRDLGVMDFLHKLKKEGKILHYGFSFHGPFSDLKAILEDEDSFEAVQLQYNYYDVDHQAGDEGIRLCGEKGIPVIVMEGLRGGQLAKVPSDVEKVFASSGTDRSPIDWAFRFLGDRPEVGLILSGMSSVEMLEENVRLFDTITVGCLSDRERAMMKEAKKVLEARTRVGCTGCGYCSSCPQNIDIPGIFEIWNESSIFDMKEVGRKRYASRVEKGTDASRCIGCRLCESLCPQHLSIPEKLQEAAAELKSEP